MEINERYKGIKPILNQEFGNNKIVSELTFCDSKGKNYWIVECICGNQRYVRTDILRRGESSQCKVCRNSQNYINNINIGLLHKKDYSPKHQGYKGLPKSIFNDYKFGAKRRKLDFKINIKYAWDLLEKQNFKCALSGIDISDFIKLLDISILPISVRCPLSKVNGIPEEVKSEWFELPYNISLVTKYTFL